ncbi:YwpF-like protein [Salsuginibacillus halophilus]|uniref:YwpF-like protein n=1 Tax=Salsuginibacillus halophilus TaxID=517424 RepID=A0A2P8HE41_9BACI|nr:YwpF family protein [Salsuginibacillus halophilus]PSL44490.1 YwpF-like protein [Salsuginibacillus halophilus]
MKTFRLKGLQLVFPGEESPEQQPVPFQDGLVINREEGDQMWLVDARLPEAGDDVQAMFDEMQETGERFVMDVTITDESNDPATMVGSVRETLPLSEGFSVLFDAYMALQQEEVFNYILESLVEDGYSGKELIEEFKNRKADQGAWSEQVAKTLYEEAAKEDASIPTQDEGK